MVQRIRSLAASAAVAALLAGCGAARHPITVESGNIGAQAVCCASFREMPYVSLPAAQKKIFQIDPESPVYAFKEGRSRFVALELPAASAVLRVRSNVITAWVEPTTFDPFVTFLDKDFGNLGESVLAMRILADANGRYREASVRVPGGASYAIVYTKPAVYFGRRLESPPALVSAAQPMQAPLNMFPILAGPRGELVVEVLTRN